MEFHFLGNAEFAKTNAQGRKRYKKKLKVKSTGGILAHKEDRERVKTGVQVLSEGRQWLNTGSRIARLLK